MHKEPNRNTALATFSVFTLNLCSQEKCVIIAPGRLAPPSEEAGECANSLVHHCVSIVKLRRGSGKDWLGLAPKAKGVKA